jgi:transketolase C-terminal domain/subunit
MIAVPPYPTVTKPYGKALVAYALDHPDIICLGADLTRQTETDAFRDHPELGSRFFNAGMVEQNLIGVAAGLAREGHTVFVNTFGVFATRRPYEQVAIQIDCPAKDRMSPTRAGALPRAPSGGRATSTGTTAAGRGRGDLIGRGGPCDGPRRAAGVRC